MNEKQTDITPITDNSEQKVKKGLKIATIALSAVAVCGVGFGIYGMMQSAQKDNQISDLKIQIKDDEGTTTTIEAPEIETTKEDGTVITITDSVVPKKNPIISANDETTVYTSGYTSSRYWGDGISRQAKISLQNGKVSACEIFVSDNNQISKFESKCEISEPSEKIYKIVEAGEGQENSGNII